MHRTWETIWHHFIPSKHNAYRPHILRRPWLLFFLTLALAAEGFLVANLLVRQSSEVFLAAVVPAQIVALTNTERTHNNLHELTADPLLTQAAQAKAEDMAAKGYFAHTGPGGVEPWLWITNVGYEYKYAGENLAVHFVDSSDVVEAWMESPTHRANIVKQNYTAIGVGVANGLYEGQPATFVVQYFAAPQAGQGASVAAAHPVWRTWVDGVQRQLLRVMGEPRSTVAWTLGIIATVLLVAVVLGFVVHIQIQPTAMLVSGGALALFTLSLIGVNSHILQTAALIKSPAAAIEAKIESKEQGAFVGEAIFIQE